MKIKTLTFLTLILTVNISIAQTVVNECFFSEGHHFNGGRIFNSGKKLFVVSSFNGRGDDPKDGYKHQFLIQHYKSNGKKVKTLFNSGEDYYHSPLSDVILFNDHFVVVTASKNTKKIKSQILVIDLKGNILKKKNIKSGGLLSTIKVDSVFLFVDREKKEYLFDVNLREQKRENSIAYRQEFLPNYPNAEPANDYPDYNDSLLTKNNIGGCYGSQSVIKLNIDSNSFFIIGCEFDSEYNNDVINLFRVQDSDIQKTTTLSLGTEGHHWVYDAIWFQGDIYAVFSCGDNKKGKELGFKDIDQFMWLVRINIQ